VIFGGFDGSFLNDIHYLDIEGLNQFFFNVKVSSIVDDYSKIVSNPRIKDLVFEFPLESTETHKKTLEANLSLFLYRFIKDEGLHNNFFETLLTKPSKQSVPICFTSSYNFELLMQYLYSGTFS
jgi:hypothetical protein